MAKIKVVAHVNSSGSAYWRIRDPFKFLNETGEFDCRVASEGITRENTAWADIIVTQSTVDKNGIALLREYQVEHGKKLVVELDDYPKLTEDNPFSLNYEMQNAGEIIKITTGIADLVTVSTPYLKKEIKGWGKNIKVLPNLMNMERWDLPTTKNNTDRVRILWAGSVTHVEDVKILRSALSRIAGDYPQTDFYFVGDIRMRDVFRALPRSEYMLGVDFEAWPCKLAGLQADIGIAPLQDREFARSKSAIKVYEYGLHGMPVVVSPVEPYKRLKGWPVRYAKTDDDWYGHLSELIVDKDKRDTEGAKLRKKIIKTRSLQGNIGMWVDAYKSIL